MLFAETNIFRSFCSRMPFGRNPSSQSGARTRRSAGIWRKTDVTRSLISSTVSTLLFAMVTTPKIIVVFLNLSNSDKSLCLWASSRETVRTIEFTTFSTSKLVKVLLNYILKLWFATVKLCSLVIVTTNHTNMQHLLWSNPASSNFSAVIW